MENGELQFCGLELTLPESGCRAVARPRRSAAFGVLLGVIVAAPAIGQGPTGAADPLDRPTEASLRMTPELARLFGRQLAEQHFARRYELPEDRVDEAGEMIARRIMQAAHGHDNPAIRDGFEEMIGAMIETRGRGPEAGGGGIPRELGQALGRGLQPVLPGVRELVNGVGRDIRPMLPVSQQLRLGADVTAFNTGLDAFEKTVERWSQGDVDPFEDPFGGGRRRNMEKDETGATQALRRAREMAEGQLARELTGEWKQYVEQAIRFYRFDESQAASAQSLLREYAGRAEAVLLNADVRDRLYHNHLWEQMMYRLRLGSANPVRRLLEDEQHKLRDPVRQLEHEFKERIERIATESQRQAAARRVHAMLADQGFDLDGASAGHEPSASPDHAVFDDGPVDPDPDVSSETHTLESVE